MAVAKKGARKGSGGKAQASVASSGNTQDNLKAAAGLWKSTPTPEAGSFGDIPDGKYQAKIEEAVIENGGKNRDRLQIKWAFRITGPTHPNRMSWMNTGLADPQGVEFSKKALAVLGLTIPEEIEQLPDLLSQVVGVPVELNLRTRTTEQGTYQNTFLNKRLDKDVSAASADNRGATEKTTTESVSFVGQKVVFKDDANKEVNGNVESQDGETLSIKDGAGEVWEVPVSEVTIYEAPKQAPSDMVGKTVMFKDDAGKGVTGKVTSANGEGSLSIQVGNDEWDVPESEVTVVGPGPTKKVIRKKA